MAGNKKCHQHLAHKEIVYFVTFIFQTQFHVKYPLSAEQTALKKTIKNILHIFARLIHHSAVGQEILQNNIVPIFSRVEQNLSVTNVYAKDLSYINKKLNNSLGSPLNRSMRKDSTANKCIDNKDDSKDQTRPRSRNERRLSIASVSGSTLLESYV